MRGTTKMFLEFRLIGTSLTGRTRIWAVLNNAGAELGEVRWKPTWRKYVFLPSSDVLFDATCLREIADFTEARTKEHYAV